MERIKVIEQAILANSFTNRNCLLDTINRGNIFRYSPHKKIYDCMLDASITNAQISSSTIMSMLPEIDIAVITDIMQSNTTHREHETLLDSLVTDYNRDKAVQLVKNFIVNSQKKKENLPELISGLENLMHTNDTEIFQDFKALEEPIQETFSADSYLSTGIKALDLVIIGFNATDLIVIAGMPGGGKTTLALQIALENKGSLFMTYEMTIKREIYAKSLSFFSGVDSMKIINPRVNINLSPEENQKIEKAKIKINETKLRMSEKPVRFHTLIIALKREIAKKKPPLILIDYVQLIDGDGDNENQKITIMTTALKKFAKVQEIPIIILSQFTKEAYKDGKKPSMANLRGSGSLAQDPNVILICHEGNVYVEKSRMTITGVVHNLSLNKSISRFTSDYSWQNCHPPEV